MSDLDGATSPGPDNAWPSTAGEFAARWNARTPEQREKFTQQLVRQAQLAGRCFQADHDGELESLLAALRVEREARARVEAIHSMKEGVWPRYAPDDFEHEREPIAWEDYTVCQGCSASPYPCRTIQALKGDPNV